ncbi:MAG TPA: TonB-dependent receptor [Ignavibacteriaceae bacterium]|nr:TonB-dependent receptor [Ignavibacteriaceae bacterium]
MKKLITIIAILSSLLFAQKQDSVLKYNLGAVVVTSTHSNLINSSSVIDVKLVDINQTDGFNITDPLKFLPGVYVTTTSKNESRIYLRGYDQRQITIFLDGVPIYEPYSGLVDLSNLPKSSIEKITISKGMPSLAYGPNSMGGTVNFITKSRMDETVSLRLESGAAHSTSLVLGNGFENFYYSLAAGYSRSDGFNIPAVKSNFRNEDGDRRNNSDYENIGGMLKLGVNDFCNFNLAYLLMIVNNEKGVPTDVYTTRPRYWRYSEWNKITNNLMFNSGIGSIFRFKGNIFFDTYKNVLNSYDDESFTTQKMNYAFRSIYDDHSFGINLLSDIDIFGFGLSRISFSWKDDVHKEEGNFNQGFSDYEATLLSTGVEQDFNLNEKISVIAAIGYDLLTPVNSNGGDLREPSSSGNGFIGLSYKFNEDISAHINASKKNRFPTLKEFYSETIGRDIANPDLNVEQSTSSELGVDYKLSKNILVNGNVFYNSIDNLINLVFLEGGLRQYQNIGKAEMKGAELGLTFQAQDFNMNLSYTYLSAKNISENKSSSILEYRPEHVLSIVPSYQFSFGTELRAELFFVGNKYGVDADSRDFVKMNDYLLVNLRTAHKIFQNYSLHIRLNNIGNIYYETEYGFPQPGRELFVGISAQW